MRSLFLTTAFIASISASSPNRSQQDPQQPPEAMNQPQNQHFARYVMAPSNMTMPLLVDHATFYLAMNALMMVNGHPPLIPPFFPLAPPMGQPMPVQAPADIRSPEPAAVPSHLDSSIDKLLARLREEERLRKLDEVTHGLRALKRKVAEKAAHKSTEEQAEKKDSEKVTFTITFGAPLNQNQGEKKRPNPSVVQNPVHSKKVKLTDAAPVLLPNRVSTVRVIPTTQAIFPLPAYSPRRLVLFNLAQQTDLQSLFNSLRPFGFINDLYMVTDGNAHHENFAVVLFQTEEEAAAAYEGLYGTTIDEQAIGIDYVQGAWDRTSRKLKVKMYKREGHNHSEAVEMFDNDHLNSIAGYCPYSQYRINGRNLHGYMVFNDLDAVAAAKTHFEQLGFQVTNIF